MEGSDEVHSLSFGSFSVTDSNLAGGQGCDGIVLDDSSSSPYVWNTTGTLRSGALDASGNAVKWQAATSSSLDLTAFKQGDNPGLNGSDDVFQALNVGNGDMVTGIVGDETLDNFPTSGLTSCADIGAVGGQTGSSAVG